MARVEIRDLGLWRAGLGAQGAWTLKGASLTVEDGEILAVVGPSGAGKTTLLRLVAGLDTPTQGSIAMDGRDMAAISPADRDVAMVFQSHALYPHLTARENLALGLTLRNHPRVEIERRVAEAAALLNLEECLDRTPAALSGGERQRVALGRAMVRQPRVFLLDEPLSDLDAPRRAQLQEEILRLHDRLGATIIHVTHDQGEALSLGDRVAVLHGGVLQQVADPISLCRQPANRFVAGFIGSPPMNLIEGTLEEESGALVFRAGEGTGGLPSDLRIRLAGNHAAALAAQAGGKLVCGFRPEHLVCAPAEPAVSAVCAGLVERREAVGPDLLLRVRVGDHRLVARCPGPLQPRPGQRVTLRIDAEAVSFFDSQTGQSLLPRTD
jgi:multiple sugar transport system ATP-binding protein